MASTVLSAELRTEFGNNASGRLRRSGFIPCVYYSKYDSPVSLQVNNLEFQKLLKTGDHVFDLNFEKNSKKVLIREIQFDPVDESILHIDLMGIHMEDTVTLNIPLKFEGNPVGARFGGIVDVSLHELQVKCKASDIPHEIAINITDLKLGDSIHVSDLKIANGEILNNPENVVIIITTPKGMSLGEEGAEEGGEAAEGGASEE